MDKTSKSIEAIVQVDGVFFYNEFKFEATYDETVEGAYDAAKESLEDKVKCIEEKAVWTSTGRKKKVFGGRVQFGWERYGLYFEVDGIYIITPNYKDYSFNKYISRSTAPIYLNAINTHGVDYFLENYKTTITSFVAKLESSLNEEIEEYNKSGSTDTSKLSKFERAKESLRDMWSILLLIQIHLPLGIENEKIMTAYESLQNLTM